MGAGGDMGTIEICAADDLRLVEVGSCRKICLAEHGAAAESRPGEICPRGEVRIAELGDVGELRPPEVRAAESRSPGCGVVESVAKAGEEALGERSVPVVDVGAGSEAREVGVAAAAGDVCQASGVPRNQRAGAAQESGVEVRVVAADLSR